MEVSTGLPDLDRVLHGLRSGDNLVWQVNNIDEYIKFVEPFVHRSKISGKKLVYFRFARHKKLIEDDERIRKVILTPRTGFEDFITKIHQVIKETGAGGHYIFDLYSDLTQDCYSDRMLGNFFMQTCPYLYRFETIAYFAILRNSHSYHAVLPIKKTTQLFIEVYTHNDSIYIHPLKVDRRYSPTMFTLHKWAGKKFIPIKESSIIADVLKNTPWLGLQSASYRLIGPWDRRFMRAEEILEEYAHGEVGRDKLEDTFDHLLSLIISTDKPILKLAKQYLSPQEIIYIWRRMIGTGMIGGKTAGMLIARAIIKRTNPELAAKLESHDSFFIGSDVFYSFLVHNGCWWVRHKQKNLDTFLDGVEEARQRILSGQFPDYIIKRFGDMLDYFGQAPIIVRSSSLLEDNFGNSFSGKYESVFCPNHGPYQQRLDEFIDAVRFIYASAMGEEALTYRAKRGVLDCDEQMALLVQRVSGAQYGNYFFPHLAGVGFSFNPYVWNKSIDPNSGMLRLVFGLGTRAVDRSDDDYTRIVALNAPEKIPEANFDEVKKHSQKRIDILDLEINRLTSSHFVDVIKKCADLQTDMFATKDKTGGTAGRQNESWIITFEKVFKETSFIEDIKTILNLLKKSYKRDVDIEFTTNFLPDGSYKINILQCRPFQVKIANARFPAVPMPDISQDKLIIKARGGVIGQSRIIGIDKIIYVVPEVYGSLPNQDRYTLARLIGRLAHYDPAGSRKKILFIGPGRWGTSMPSLGVPVSFHEINTAAAICEIDSMHEGLVPDLSLGTHFFNDLVEMDILYIAYFNAQKENLLNDAFFLQSRNMLSEIFPDEARWQDAVKVICSEYLPDNPCIMLNAASREQTCKVYLE